MGAVYWRRLREPPPGGPSLLAWAGPAAAAALALWLTAPAWGGGPPAGDDVMAHLVRSEFGLDEILGRARLDGWFPRFMVGHQEFQFYGPGFTWAVGLLRLLSLGTLSTAGALKVVVILSFVTLGPAVAFLARSAGLSARASGVAAVLALAVNSPFGVGIAGVFTIGLFPHQLAGTFFCLALGAALRAATDPRRRWVVLLAASLAAVVVTHLITAVVLALFLILFLVTLPVSDRPTIVAVARLAVGGTGAALLSAFWLLPLVAHRDERGPVTTWGTEPIGRRLTAVFDGDILFAPNLAWLAALGLLFGLARVARRRRWSLAVALAAPAYLLVAHGAYSQWKGNEVTLQLANRGLGYAGLVAVLPLAALLARLATEASTAAARAEGAAHGPGWRTAGDVAALAAAVALVVLPGSARDTVRQLPEPSADLRAAAAVLAEAVPDGARFATERDFPGEIARTGISHPDLWLARASGRNTLNIFNLESSPAPGAGLQSETLGEDPPEHSARALARMGTTHVVTMAPETPDLLVASGHFLPVWRGEAVAVLEVVPPPGQPEPASLASTPAGEPLSASLDRAEPEHLVLSVDVPGRSWVTVAVGWSPKWRAEVGGVTVPARRSADGLVEVEVPPGGHRVDLRFERDGWDRAGAVVSGLALLGLAGAAAVRARRYWSSRMSSSFSRTA